MRNGGNEYDKQHRKNNGCKTREQQKAEYKGMVKMEDKRELAYKILQNPTIFDESYHTTRLLAKYITISIL